MPLNDNETPGQAMKRIEGEMRSPARPQMAQTFTPLAGAQRGMEGYSANVGAGVGPLSAMGLVSADKETGAPTVAGGRVGLNAGPVNLGYIHMQPAAPVKPVQGVQLNVPFDADSYFGVQATKTPGGNQYGVNVGKGGLNAYGSYNPTRRDLSAGFQFERRFADGGPVLTSKRIASSFVPPEEQGAISPSMEGVIEGAQAVGRGLGPALQATGEYITSTRPGQVLSDVGTLAGGMYEAAKQNPAEFIGGMLPGIGNIYSLRDIDELKGKIAAARAAGDEATALRLEKFAPLAAVGAAAPFGAGAAVGAVTKAAERSALKGAERAAMRGAEEVAIRSANETASVAEKFANKAGTPPEELASMFDDVRGTQVGKMVQRYQELPPEESMQLLYQDLKGLAIEGDVGKEWYERSSQRILDFVGGDKEAADKFAQLIAIYSPQTAVDVNTQNAMKAYNRSLAGEKLWDGEIVSPDMSFPTIKASDDYVRSLGGSKEGYTKIPLDDSGKRFLIAKHGDTSAYENIATLDRDLKAHLVMNEGVPFNGRKINNFYNNLMVQIDPSRLQGSTQDLWMARAFGYLDDAVGGTKKYELMERMTADLAEELGWQPHQVQAAIWTAMKTRQEGVKDAVKASALDMGIAERVPDPANPGKMIFKVKEGKEAEYGALMREQSLGSDVTPEAIAAAARDFSDFLDQNLAHVSWESAPSTRVGHLEGFEGLNPEAKAEYHVGIQQALQGEDGQDLLARYLNILSPGAIDAPGYWEGASNPATLRQVGATRIKGAKQAPDIDSASKEMMEIYAAGLGLLLKQDGVGYHRPYFNPQITKANGVEFRFENPLSRDDIVALGKALDEKFGGSVAMIPAGESEIRFLNFGSTKNQKDFHKAVAEIVGGANMENSAKARAFASDGDLVSNNWQERPNGEDYIRRLSASGRSDVLEYISDFLAPRVEAFDSKFAAQYGLKRNESLEAQIRNAKNLADGRPEGEKINYAEGGKVERSEAGIRAALVDLREAARERNIYRPKLAYLIRQMGGADHRRSQLLANNLLSDDLDDLVGRLKDQPRAVPMIKKLTAKID